MKSGRLIKTGAILGLAAGLHLGMVMTQFAQQAPAPTAGQAAPPAARGGGARGQVDPRVQERKYEFKDTNEQLPYALFVSSKVSKDKKNPLIVSLHGLGGTQDTMVQTSFKAVDLAEEGGYIYVAPMGYSSDGWYGIPIGAPRGGGAPAGATGAAARGAGNGAPGAAAGARGAGGAGRGAGVGAGGTAITDNVKKREASEKDVMTVLDMIRKEFNVDERRIYVMGHSMGGSGTLYLASKYPQIWAAAAAIAPPGAGGPGVAESLGMSKLPTMVTQGDADTAVPVAGTRAFIDRLKAQNAVFEYIEEPGADHGTIIAAHMADIFKFFGKNTKPAK